jgi:hypothetical protein
MWWCTPRIPAIAEAKIRRIIVLKSDQAKNFRDPISTNKQVWWIVPVIPAIREAEIKDHIQRMALSKKCGILSGK